MVLDYLHTLISKVCPIEGLAFLENGSFRLDFAAQATEEQKNQALSVLEQWPLLQAKEEKLLNIAAEWGLQLKQGWDSGQGRLGLTAEDVALLSGAFTLAKEAAALGLPLPKLITLDDTTIPFATIQEMTTLLLRYGAARAELSETFAARRKAVESATTLEELNALP